MLRKTKLSLLFPAVGALVALAGTACIPPGSGGGARYVDVVFDRAAVTKDVAYATGVPALVTGTPTTLRLDVYQPAGDPATNRPAVIWVHGGGFRIGSKAAVADVASDYARRGYVTFSINYRLDPGNRCQDLQDGTITDPDEYARERARCAAAVFAAQHDAQASVRWVRAHASTYRIDATKIAMGGFSAGAVTALHVAYRSDDPGDVGDNDGVDSRVAAALSASGCNYVPESIGAGDAPVFLLHAEFDRAVPFSCARQVADLARKAGLVAQTLFFFGESTHAKLLYEKYRTRVDAAWTGFLVEQLHLR